MNRLDLKKLAEVVTHGDVTEQQLCNFEDRYRRLRVDRNQSIFRWAMGGICVFSTALLYFLLCIGPLADDGRHQRDLWSLLNPVAHPWLCLFLLLVWIIIGLIYIALQAADKEY